MRQTLLITTLVLLGLPNLVVEALADNHEAPANVAEVWIFTPRDGQQEQLAQGIKAHGNHRAAAGDSRAWQVYSVEAGEDLRPFYIRYCCFRWSERDAYEHWRNESGVMEHFAESMGPHIAETRHEFHVLDLENSQYDPEGGPYRYVGVTRWTPNPANAMASGAARNAMSQLAKENGWDGQWLWFNTLGGATSLSLASLFKDFADMAPPEKSFYAFAAEHAGEEETRQWFNDFNSGFWTSEYTIYRHRDDLSMTEGD